MFKKCINIKLGIKIKNKQKLLSKMCKISVG